MADDSVDFLPEGGKVFHAFGRFPDGADELRSDLVRNGQGCVHHLLDLLLDDSLEGHVGREQSGTYSANILDDDFDLASQIFFVNFALGEFERKSVVKDAVDFGADRQLLHAHRHT